MNKVITFILGAAIGSVVTWKIVENKYKKLADEEIMSVIERFKTRYNTDSRDNSNDKNTVDPNIIEEDKTEYNNKVKDLGYATEKSDDAYTVMLEEQEDIIAPYTIAPEEFGEKEGYETKSWTYYDDLVLTDENEEVVDNPEEIIGDGLEHFGEFEEDSVYVRNENTKCDYEILKHEKAFSEISKGDI